MSSEAIVTPAFQSAHPDSGDATKLGPSAWNAPRIFSGGAPGDLLLADAESTTGAAWVPLAESAIQTAIDDTAAEAQNYTDQLAAMVPLTVDLRAVTKIANYFTIPGSGAPGALATWGDGDRYHEWVPAAAAGRVLVSRGAALDPQWSDAPAIAGNVSVGGSRSRPIRRNRRSARQGRRPRSRRRRPAI